MICALPTFFSERLAREQNVSADSVKEFFLNDFKRCTFGKADLKEEIASFLPKWHWQGTVDELLTYWFESESMKDAAALEIVTALRAKGIKCYIATRQEKYRFNYLLKDVGLENYFDGAFSTCNIGYDKSDPKFYEEILKELSLDPSEVLFFDDTQMNVDTAKDLGIDAYFYKGIETLKKHVSEIEI